MGNRRKREVSIQLLFLFNLGDPLITDEDCFVSIQLLFLFNKTIEINSKAGIVVSIQLLFLFNGYRIARLGGSWSFQYSFCSYSTVRRWNWQEKKQCFNTASVLIQLSNSIVEYAIFFVSIQLLFLFNTSTPFSELVSASFNTASVLIQLKMR